MNDQTGARPTRPAHPDDLADWQCRTFTALGQYVDPPPGELSLDDEVADDPAADPAATLAHLAELRAAGRI